MHNQICLLSSWCSSASTDASVAPWVLVDVREGAQQATHRRPEPGLCVHEACVSALRHTPSLLCLLHHLKQLVKS